MGNTNTSVKKEYAKPSLIRKGTVRSLTKGSGGSSTDGIGPSKDKGN